MVNLRVMRLIRIYDPYSPFPAVIKRPFPSAACENLGFDNHVVAAWGILASLITFVLFHVYCAPILFATVSASAADRATSPFGTPMPYYQS